MKVASFNSAIFERKSTKIRGQINALAVLVTPQGRHRNVEVSMPSDSTRSILRLCAHCGTRFFAIPSRIRKGLAKFCSRTCFVESRVPTPASNAERFWSKVEKRGDDECWLWTAADNGKGYGHFKFGGHGKTVSAHRFSYELHFGPVPENLHIDHVLARGCTSRRCVNPAHLEAVTQRENNMRGRSPIAENNRKTHCPRGHELVGENLRIKIRASNGRPVRECRSCVNAQQRAHNAKKRTALAATAAA